MLLLDLEAKRSGMKAETISNRPKTLVSNMPRVRAGSASIAGASYTVQEKRKLIREEKGIKVMKG